MIEVKDLLNKFNHFLSFRETKKQILKEVLFEVVGIEIEKENITIKNNIIFLDIKPIYKNEIFLKKEIIFSKLQAVFGKETPSDIK